MPPRNENKEGKEQLAPPAQPLLAAIRHAWKAGVPASEAIPLIDMARNATGYKAQVWRSVAQTLEDYATEAENRSASTPPVTPAS